MLFSYVPFVVTVMVLGCPDYLHDSPLLINVMVTVNEIQVHPSQSLNQVGVEVILWTAHCTSYSVSWLYQSFLNCPNKLVHCRPVPLLCLLYWFCYQFYSMLSSQLWLLKIWITCHHNHHCIFMQGGLGSEKNYLGSIFFPSPSREPTYIIIRHYHSCDIAIVENLPRLPPVWILVANQC